MSSRVVGVVFDDSTLRAVELERRNRSRRAEDLYVSKACSMELPRGLVDQGDIADVSAFADRLRELWKTAEFSTKRVSIGLDARAAVIRRAVFPGAVGKNLQQAAEFEIGDLLSYRIDEAIVSAIDVDGDRGNDSGAVHALILATKQDTILDLRAAIKAADLKPVSIELTQTAVTHHVGGPNPLPDGSVGVIIDVSPTITNIIVHEDEGILFSRVVTAGVSVSPTSLSDELQQELMILDSFGGGVRSGGAIDPTPAALASSTATVVEGVRRTIHYFRSELDDRPIGRITLCGAMSASSDLASGLSDLFPDAEVVRHRREQWPDAVQDPSEFDEASAVAAIEVIASNRVRNFDLMPTSVREHRAGLVRTAAGIAIALVLAPVLLRDATNRTSAENSHLTSVHATERVVDGLRTELASYGDAQALEADARRQTDRVNQLLDQDYGFTTIIRQLTEATPADSFLLSLRVQRAQAGEAPLGYDGPPPPAVLTATGVTKDLPGVSRWLTSVDDVPSLAGLWLDQSAVGPYDAAGGTATVFTIEGAIVAPADPISRLAAIK